MRTKKVTRHYCDFCKKSMAFKSHMEKHEKHCTMNPNRSCGLCEIIGESPRPIAELLAVMPNRADFEKDGLLIDTWLDSPYELAGKEALKKLRELTNNCPACILATLRQSDFKGIEFNFQEESKNFLGENYNPNEGIGY